METECLQTALEDFEKKSQKEASPLLEQFLCHIAKTGETILQWSQFKNYFLFKLEQVMDDFKASAPEQRGPANSNVESIPFEDMKERILRIVQGYNGIPFTIQRLCELLTEPNRNYRGTEKFLRGVEKNVMVVTCVHPTSERNGCSAVNRMNGGMLPGNISAFTERKVNGPGTPRPVNGPKMSFASSMAANGLMDSGDNKDDTTELGGGESEVSTAGGSPGSSVKSRHLTTEDETGAKEQEVKRLKFCEEECADDEDEAQEDDLRPSHAASLSEEEEAMVQEDEEARSSQEKEASSIPAEPSSSAPAEASADLSQDAEGRGSSQEDSSDMDQTDQMDQTPAVSGDSSSSSSHMEEDADSSRKDGAHPPSSSTTDVSTGDAVESASSETGTSEGPMEQD